MSSVAYPSLPSLSISHCSYCMPIMIINNSLDFLSYRIQIAIHARQVFNYFLGLGRRSLDHQTLQQLS